MRPPRGTSTRHEISRVRGRARNLERRIAPATPSAYLHWGVNTDSGALGLTLNAAGAVTINTGGSDFATIDGDVAIRLLTVAGQKLINLFNTLESTGMSIARQSILLQGVERAGTPAAVDVRLATVSGAVPTDLTGCKFTVSRTGLGNPMLEVQAGGTTRVRLKTDTAVFELIDGRVPAGEIVLLRIGVDGTLHLKSGASVVSDL